MKQAVLALLIIGIGIGGITLEHNQILSGIDTHLTWESNLQQENDADIYQGFTSHYSPLYISAGTFNTEFIANTSLIPSAVGIDNKVYINNSYPFSIAN